MAELFTTPARATDANGENLSGAKWFFYQTGTLTPQSVFTTAALSTAHLNPVVADAAGKFPAIYFDTTKQYRGILRTADEATVIYDLDPINAGVMSILGAPSGSAEIGFLQAGTGAVARTTQAKMRDAVSIEDFRTGTAYSAAEDLAAFNAAVAAGHKTIILPRATYNLTGAVIPSDSAVRKIIGHRCLVTVTAATNAVGITVNKQQFVDFDGIDFISSGTETDGLNTTAIKWAASASYMTISNGRIRNFSGAGVNPVQCVNFRFYNLDFQDCYRAYKFDPNGGLPCTAVLIDGGYVSGCRDGVYSLNGLTDYTIINTIFEYCGDIAGAAGTAAINITGGTGTIGDGNYFEANYRNLNLVDTLAKLGQWYELSASNASVFSWSGVAFADRGYAKLTHRALTVTDIKADTTSENAIRIVGPVSTAASGTALFNPAGGILHHYKAGEVRVRYEGSTAVQSWETIVGGGGVGASGWMSFYDVNNSTVRLELQPGTGTVGVRGNGAAMEFWINGTKVIGTRGAALPADATDLATAITLVNAIKARMVAHGLVAA